MKVKYDNVLIIADIEGSSGCWSYEDSRFMTEGWAWACVDMSLDINAVVTALFKSGVTTVTVKDFHRTGYNLLPELIDRRVRIIHGYRRGSVPGIGDPGGAEAVMMTGMHAAGGSDGFLAHTLTSRVFSRIEVNGKILSEGELFASSLAPFDVIPIFFSGGPVACRQAKTVFPWIATCPIEKNGIANFDIDEWREQLAAGGVESLYQEDARVYSPRGPFSVSVHIKEGEEAAEEYARRWGLEFHEGVICFSAETMKELFSRLIRLAYFTPFTYAILSAALVLSNARGYVGLNWVRYKNNFLTKP